MLSGINNLRDITLPEQFSAICGYTDADVDSVFADQLAGLDREQIRRWYNGYNWTGTKVYNPFDFLLLFAERKFNAWWCSTGTPTFLFKMMQQQGFFTPLLKQMGSGVELISALDVDLMTPEALRDLFQSFFAGSPDRSIPHQWYTNNEIAQYEGYYASVFYSYFAALGLDTQVEDATNLGRIDMTLKGWGRIYLFEFKVVESAPGGAPSAGRALQQIKDKGYADKYRAQGLPIYLIGVEFSKDQRNVVGFEVELIKAEKATD